MLKPIAACLLPVIVAVAACTARAQGDPPPASSSADLQKFDAALAFLRARNARDYAPASPNSIDLGGWAIADRLKNKHVLAGKLSAGGTVRLNPDAAAPLARLATRVAPLPLFRYHRALLQQRAMLSHPLQSRLVAEAMLLDYQALF